jgi:2-oxoglutarate dehydrogenase E2 component (dihydrolipoamide succinyltransferase)
MNMVEATVERWLKDVGDTVAEGDELAEIATDKVDAELESPYAGTLVEIVVQAGEDAEVGDVLAYIEVGS